MTEMGRLGAFITKVKKGSLADVVGHLRAGANILFLCSCFCTLCRVSSQGYIIHIYPGVDTNNGSLSTDTQSVG